jgi:Flp pilus assembly protein TadG
MRRNKNREGRRGNAVIEVALMAPWIFFLFVGVLDFGFYAYSFISVENAARAAALLMSKSKVEATDPAHQADACAIVLSEMTWAAYGRNISSTCSTAPLTVKATLLNDQTTPRSQDGFDAVQVEVQYTTLTMVPIPGVLPSSFVVDRRWEMKIDPTADY